MAKTTYKKKIKNGKEYYFFRLRHDNLKKPKDLYAKTVKELESKIKSMTYELDHGVKDNKEVFGAFFRDWLFDIHFLHLKGTSKERYEALYRVHIKNSPIASIKLNKLTAMDIQKYYNNLILNGKSVSLIKNLNKLIAASLRYAYNNDLMIKDISRAYTIPKETSNKSPIEQVKPFSLEEQKMFLSAIKGIDLETFFLTALNSGLRQGELLALTWNDINLDNNTITVNKGLERVYNVSKEGKNGSNIVIQSTKTVKSNRIVTIPLFLSKKLKQHKLKQNELKLKLGNLYQDNNLVFCTKRGNYLSSFFVRKKFKEILVNNNLEDRKFHDLRHTYATRLFELGESPKTVQELLGHSNISTTMNIYTHVMDSMKEKATSKLDHLYTNLNL